MNKNEKPPIRAEDIEASIIASQQQLQEIQSIIVDRFSSSFFPFDIDDSYTENDMETKQQMVADLMLVLETQDQIGGELGEPWQSRFNATRDMIAVLAERLQHSKENIADSNLIEVTEAHREAYLLEAIRRTTYPGTYLLVEAAGEGPISDYVPSFNEQAWWDRLHEQMSEEKVYKGFSSQKEHARKRLEQRSQEEWKGIIEKQETYLLQYFQKRSGRSTKQATDLTDFLSRFTKNDQRVFSDEQVHKVQQVVEVLSTYQEELHSMTSFTEISDWLKAQFGDDTTYEMIFKALPAS